MAKTSTTLATVISIKPSGENNSSVTLLTQNEGIVYATLYGGPKSRLKSLVSPWNTGKMWLSQDKGLFKISDFDVISYRLSFRENLQKSWTASLAAEIAMKTKCAGSAARCWPLINGFLDGLEFCSESDQITAGLIRFLWRYLELMGVQPDAENCCHCGEKFRTGASWNPSENGFCCNYCNQKKTPASVPQNGMEYLSSITKLPPKDARNVLLLKESVSQVKETVFFLIENACGTPLSTLKTGIGIL